MAGLNSGQAVNPAALIALKTGDWWQDERRNWCAYCGIRMRTSKGHERVPSGATEDHVIPLAHGGCPVTIPSCRGCNEAKGSASLPEFLTSSYFDDVRKRRHRYQWPLRNLWLVLAWASVERADRVDCDSTTKIMAKPQAVPVRVTKLPPNIQIKARSSD